MAERRPHPSYRHVQAVTVLWWAAAVAALCSTAAPVVIRVAAGSAAPDAAMLLPALATAKTFAALLLFFGRLWTEVDATSLRFGYGFVGWPRWQVDFVDIERVERVPIAPVLKAWSEELYAGKGLELKAFFAGTTGDGLAVITKDGRRRVIGSADAARLAAFVEARLPPPARRAGPTRSPARFAAR
jgi:hypothetical protein